YTQEAAILRSDATYLAYASPEDHPNSLNTGSDANPLLRQAANEFPDSGPGSLSPDLALQDGDKDEMPVTEYYVTTEKNGIRGFYAKKGDLLLEYALTHRVRYARLLEWNDLPDAPLEENMFIYLSKKRRS